MFDIKTLLAMIPGAEEYKRQGIELIEAARKLTDAIDAVANSSVVGHDELATIYSANNEFKACIAKLPPLPEGL